MRPILAIAGIAIRSAIRSRIVIVLIVLLTLFILGLPLTIKGDGTVGGFVQITLGYSLGFTSVLLSIATVWAACASVSSEIKERQIQLVTTKPVFRMQIWIGKWLGLIAVNAALILYAGIVVYSLLLITTRPRVLSIEDQKTLEGQILVARDEVPFTTLDLDDQARHTLQQRLNETPLPSHVSEEQALEQIRRSLLNQAFTVSPTHQHVWQLSTHAKPTPGHAHVLRFKFSSSEIGPGAVRGKWEILSDKGSVLYEVEDAYDAGREHALQFEAQNEHVAEVRYTNFSTPPVTVFFSPSSGFQFLVYKGTFLMNFTRALLLLFMQLAFLAAVGLTAGTMFSMPVAALVSLYVVLLLKLAPFVEDMASKQSYFHTHHGGESPFSLDHFFHVFFQVMHALLQPLQSPNAYEQLATGLLVPWSVVAHSFLLRFVVYSGLVALLGSWIFNRRELAMPAQ